MTATVAVCRIPEIRSRFTHFLFRGFGFVTFADPAAIEAVLAVGRHEIDEKMVNNKLHLH